MDCPVRLRQVALVARDVDEVSTRLQSTLQLDGPFHDPGVGEFGLTNAVFAVGDTFVEIVSPARPGTTAGRYLDRLGGDGGYMAIFQLDNLDDARARADSQGIRVVWQIDLPDMSGTHLHPRDVPGAIVSLDAARPTGSWRWAGPTWTAVVPDHGPGGLTSITVEVADPIGVAATWAQVLGVATASVGDASVIDLECARQRLRFESGSRGITAIGVTGVRFTSPAVIGGVTFRDEEY